MDEEHHPEEMLFNLIPKNVPRLLKSWIMTMLPILSRSWMKMSSRRY
jgi:hypothetical protein